MNPMSIVAIDCIPMQIPFHHWSPAPLFAGKPRTTLDSALVRVKTSCGLTGWGESYCVDAVALTSIFKNLVSPLALGRQANDDDLLSTIQRPLHNLGRSGPVAHALAGLDIALWDIRGKAEGVPVYELLGGKLRSKVTAYASLLQYYADPERISRTVTRALNEGYREIKLHERTAVAVQAARSAMDPNMPLMLDTNCAWTLPQALDETRAMHADDPYWIEEPLWPPEDTEALIEFRRISGFKTAAGENASSPYQLLKRIECNAVDFIQPSVIKLGLTETWKIAQATQGTTTSFAPQVAFFGPGYLAVLHMLAATHQEASLERLYVELQYVPYAETVPIINGAVVIPDRAGLGADPESHFIEGRLAS
ncbi:mandelate racemase/muconate lactonizing enzyme family protein [Pseudomonas oryzihabitans]|uniref:mandelate racemase/muconate lactonizing enzyme family protein n=1 Tax=Pseudomonas oryzihabitans TaxID=47885 RepID=UPI00119E6957|nr:mandelate racemase/muconate lactonizing enzyme family protein [Pseudomonas oryzihabitans]